MCIYLDCQQVMRVIPKQAKKIMRSAMESAKITWIKARRGRTR